ncbi:diaminopimelate decarboxylase [Candidatus Woesearchaeota archaeon]|nr:diaminopimelate decarboxylase [Candidatus Woesearchaeota archaeon]
MTLIEVRANNRNTNGKNDFFIGPVSVRELIERFDTPLYVYDAGTISRQVRSLHDAGFDSVRYAIKANNNPAVLKLIMDEGASGVDVVSAGELLIAQIAGILSDEESPRRVVFGADFFANNSHDLEHVIKLNATLNAGSINMIQEYGEMQPGIKDISIRLNPGFGHGHTKKVDTGGEHSKHGIWYGDASKALRTASDYGLRVNGLHMHIGTGTNLWELERVAESLITNGQMVRDLEYVSAGGGIPVPYKEGDRKINLQKYRKLLANTERRLSAFFGRPINSEIEPGRYLVAESGYLVGRIRDIKSTPANKFYLVDFGFDAMPRAVLYGAHHDMLIVGRNSKESEVIVGGPLCESGDVFTQEQNGDLRPIKLPRAEIGDIIIMKNVGAYGMSMASNYNSRFRPAEVMVNTDGSYQLIRSREGVADLTRNVILHPEKITPRQAIQ